MEQQINDAGGAIFAAYEGATMETLASQYVGAYMQGSYWTTTVPSVPFSFWPYTAVINMRDGTVIAKDTDSTFLSTADIIAAVESVQ